jgi:hypothetical protein
LVDDATLHHDVTLPQGETIWAGATTAFPIRQVVGILW